MSRLRCYLAAAAVMSAGWLLTVPWAETAAAQAARETAAAGGIQWFTRLKDGLAEARRTGKPILYLSAAPSCGGIPGTW
jgi:hypothetical protein